MSNATDHLAKARDYITIAESQDSKREAYMKAADEIIAAQFDDSTLSNRTIAKTLSKHHSWVADLVQWRTSGGDRATPFAGSRVEQDPRQAEREAHRALADPEQRRQVIASLPPEQVEQVIETANEVAIERSRAHYAERNTAPRPPNAGDLTGGEKWDPSESWADTLILRVDTNTRALENHVRQWGLVIGSLNDDDALAYVEQSERRLAEVRAALQERARDRAREEV